MSELRTCSTDDPQAQQTIEWPDGGLDVLAAVIRTLGQVPSRSELIEQVNTDLARRFNADWAALLLHDAAQCQLWTFTGPKTSPRRLGCGDHEGLCGHVFHECESNVIGNRQAASGAVGAIPSLTGAGSLMAAPVICPDQVCKGVLVIAAEGENHFDESGLGILGAVSAFVGVVLTNADRYESERRQFTTTVRSISEALDARDAVTKHHSINVANYARGIGALLGLDSQHLEWLLIAAMLHDIGTIGTPDSILTKAGRLQPAEYDEVKKHARYTRKILEQIEFAERYDAMAYLGVG